ncbi:MAG: hypothetical protein R3Y16_05180 [Rikenellaceae bacterium]
MGDTKPLLYFRYKGEDIYMENIHNPQNENQEEFDKLIKDLNIEHSYKDIIERGVENVPIEVIYKGNTTSFADMITEYKKLSAELKNLDFIASLELKYPVITSIKFVGKDDDYMVYIETCRMLQDLYLTIVNARYNLLQASRKIYDSNVIVWNSNSAGQFIMRSIYLNNAIVGYNSAIDILTQCIWLGKRLFLEVENNKNDKKCYSRNEIFKFSDEKIENIRSKVKKGRLKDDVKFKTADLWNGSIDKILEKCNLDTIIKIDKTLTTRQKKMNAA